MKIWKFLGILISADVLILVLILAYAGMKPAVPGNYETTVKTGGEIEAYYLAHGNCVVKYTEQQVMENFKKYEIYYPAELETSDHSFMTDPKKLTEEETVAVNKVREIFASMGMIPCTACHYCVLDNDCPKKIQIPELFSCYNLKTTFHSWNTDYYYKNILTRDHGKASDCLKCGKCEKICPQHLPIRKLLEQVAEEFEQA